MTQKYRRAKLRELVLYVAAKSRDDPAFDTAKLDWLLYYADFLAYGVLGRAVTGATYVRAAHGPTPRQLASLQQELLARQEVALAPRQRLGRLQRTPVPLRLPNLSAFPGEEIALVDEVIEKLRGIGASDAATVMRKAPGWRFARKGEPIPYASVFLSDEPLTPADLTWAREIAERYALTATR